MSMDYFVMLSEETTMEIIIPKFWSLYIHELLEIWFQCYPFIHLLFDTTVHKKDISLNSTEKMDVYEDNLDLIFWRSI